MPWAGLYFFYSSIKMLQAAVDSNPAAPSSKPLVALIKQLQELRKATLSLLPQALFANVLVVGWPWLRAKVDYWIAAQMAFVSPVMCVMIYVLGKKLG